MIRLWPEMQWEDFLSETNPSGIVVDTLGRGIPMAQGEAALLLRVTYAPGSHLPPHTDPGTGVWVVERGMIGFGVQEGEAVITRASGASGERVGAGVEVILEPGDTASYGPDNVHTTRNAGAVEAEILIGGADSDALPQVHPAPGA